MKFQQLYQKMRESFTQNLTALWCSRARSESQRAYIAQLKALIPELFAPKSAMPIVQCNNSYQKLTEIEKSAANELIGGLWTKPYSPYVHQRDCWRVLSETMTNGDKKSIVVTTGTGSGKTECFMLPLVHDLNTLAKQGQKKNEVQALFLYPLNALMEDQKERLNDFLESTDLSFAVYNGRTEEREPSLEEIQDSSEKKKALIKIRTERQMYSKIVATRSEIRSQAKRPNILLTNPTMLEYMLLRKDDQPLFTSGSLRWIVIDETHTYTGAGAAELAMLIRRVLKAFNVDPKQVRFATSSATLGNGEMSEKEADDKLRTFISDITGQNKEQIEVVKGNPHEDNLLVNPGAEACRKILLTKEYVYLDEAVPGEGLTIEQRLAALDEYCDAGLKAKVHFFNRVQNTGLKVQLENDLGNGSFEIRAEVPADADEEQPYLDLVRCNHCGEFLAVGEYQEGNETHFDAVQMADNDIFTPDDASSHKLYFALTKNDVGDEDKGQFVSISKNEMTETTYRPGQWNLLRGTSTTCPCCGVSLTVRHTNADNEEEDEFDQKKVTDMRVSVEFASRVISPALISEAAPSDKEGVPSQGRQFISFVDSRSMAARATLSQTKEQEKLWVYSRVYEKLIAMAADTNAKDYLSWVDIYEFLKKCPELKWLCQQNVNRNDINHDEDKEKETCKYLYSVMYGLLARRPIGNESPENLGLFTSYYPKLEQVIELPQSVVRLNASLAESKKIEVADWKALLKMFMDFNVRSNEALFFSRDGYSLRYMRYSSVGDHRRPITFPFTGKSYYRTLLTSLTDEHTPLALIDEVLKEIKFELQRIELIKQENGAVIDEDGNWRLELNDLCFKLYDKYTLCKVKDTDIVRPYDTLFKGMSVYGAPKNEGLQSVKWDEEFACVLKKVRNHPDIFIQAEHTAQIEKEDAKEAQEMFKNKEINILACSTTMEMGVDLGDLEIVLLSSIPPYPANYKQRAGRSGRDLNMPRSVCVTLCGSNSIGLRTLYHPMTVLIDRPTAVPCVDLNSPQIVQRHVNAYLLRESNCLTIDHGYNEKNPISARTLNFFTNYEYGINPKTLLTDIHSIKDKGQDVYPIAGLGDVKGSMHNHFLSWLDNRKYDKDGLMSLVSGTCLSADMALLNVSKETIRIYEEFKARVDELQEEYVSVCDELCKTQPKLQSAQQYQIEAYIDQTRNNALAMKARALRMKFYELMGENLLAHLSTHRYTPNANMPVNVVAFDVNNEHYSTRTNPSYQLQEALSQYAPGNNIVLRNVSYMVRGVSYTGKYKDNGGFKRIYYNQNHVAVDEQLADPFIWEMSGKTALQMITPYEFKPDRNEEPSRCVVSNKYTRVEAQLVGAEDWSEEVSDSIFMVRRSRHMGNSRVLYYNAGLGFGYCVCAICGRTALETGVSRGSHNKPKEMEEHKDIRYKNKSSSSKDKCKANVSNYRRNVILGDTIQTDYCEIRIKPNMESEWINDRVSFEELQITLAIAIHSAFVEYLGVERRDVSFLITTDGHICIYDTNPGGSGYSNRLAERSVFMNVLNMAKQMIDCMKSKDEILDRFTERYINKIDKHSALKWLEKATECRIPEHVEALYHDNYVIPSSMSELQSVARQESVTPILFTQSNSNEWNYNAGNALDEDWLKQTIMFRNSRSKVAVVSGIDNMLMSNKDKLTLAALNNGLEYVNFVSYSSFPKGVYPIMYAGNRLYFTTDGKYANLNEHWGEGDLYSVVCAEPVMSSYPIEFDFSDLFFINDPHFNNIISKKLPVIVHLYSETAIKQFKDYLDNNCMENDVVTVEYQDEHIKTGYGIVMVLQFINYYIKLFEHPVDMQFIVEEYSTHLEHYSATAVKMLTQEDRDNLMESLLDEWCENRVTSLIERENCKVLVKESGTLEHYRRLRFKCGSAVLDIYPHGGIVNEWNVNFDQADKFYDYDNLSMEDDIPLSKQHDIVYWVKYSSGR